MDVGDELVLDVTDVAHDGVFVARHGGRVVFVSDAIPGEQVVARLTEVTHASYWRAVTVDIRDASPHRRAHVWPAADVGIDPEQRPGGADFGHIEFAHQRELKARVLRDALARMASLDVSVDVEPAGVDESADGTRWRTRVSLHVDDHGRAGPFAARSHRVIPVSDHPLATAAIERAMTTLRAPKPGRVDLVQPADGRVRVVHRPARRAPTTRRAPDVIVEHVAGREFRLDVDGFWQVHRLAAATLTSIVRDELDRAGGVDADAEHLDLYGGVGLFAAVLAELAGPAAAVTTVEADARATHHARTNLAGWPALRAETGRVDRWLAARADAASPRHRPTGVVLLDPPRSGAGREVVALIAALDPTTVVYVACDPVALARDLALLRTAGYEPASLRAVDLFPHSHHLESVALLTRR